MNIFLDGLPDEDFRGWKYDEECICDRCIHFYEAAYALVASKEFGKPLEDCYDKASQ